MWLRQGLVVEGQCTAMLFLFTILKIVTPGTGGGRHLVRDKNFVLSDSDFVASL